MPAMCRATRRRFAPGNQIAEAAAFNALDHEKNDDNIDLTALVRYSYDANLDMEFGLHARYARQTSTNAIPGPLGDAGRDEQLCR